MYLAANNHSCSILIGDVIHTHDVAIVMTTQI